MKRFELCGQILGLILITLGLIFTGCAGPGGNNGSSEAVAPAATQGSYGAIPISINGQNGDLRIGAQADGLSDSTTVSGHLIEIVDGSTSVVAGKGNCGGGIAGDIKCWIKLVNKDPSAGMYNISLNANSAKKCVNCGTAVFNDADNVNGNTTRDIGQPNIDTPILGSGFCYAEDGDFKAKKPFNAMGCTTYYTPNGSYKPMQALHPVCGQRSELLDFGNPSNPTAKYTFWASVSATYFPWNPVGANGAPGGGDDDPRYDFQNYSTVYIILADMANTHPGRYIMGSWKRSNIIAGYGSPGNVSGAGLTPGTYFGVNIAVEAPDRLENYYMADRFHLTSNPRGYEYYLLGAVFFRYNPFVIERVRATSHSGQAYIKNGARDICFIYPNTPCGNIMNYQSYSHLEPVADGMNSTYGFGWVGMFRSPELNTWKYYATTGAMVYHTDGGGLINIYTNAKVCKECGQKGFAKINRSFLGATINSTNTSASRPAFVRDGPDAEPENTWMVYHFFVKSNAVAGLSSELRADTFSSYTQFMYALHTSQTSLLPGGYTLDWSDYCYPFNTTPPEVHYCPTPFNWTSDIIVFQSHERLNLNIHQSGEAVSGGGGGVQAWNTYVCVQ